MHTFAVHQKFTVHEAIAALLERNCDHYRLDLESGSGCWYWCEVVLRDFVEYGWVEATAAARVEHVTSWIKEHYADVDIPMPAPRGQFY